MSVGEVKKIVNRVLQCAHEAHAITIALSSYVTTATPVLNHLTAITQGADLANRLGDKIEMLKLNLRFQIIMNSSGLSTQWVRTIIFQDKQQAQDTTPTSLLLMGTASPAATEIPSYINRGRFHIVDDFMLQCSTVAANGPLPAYRDYVRSYPASKFTKCVSYNGTANSDINENGLYIMSWSSEVTNGPAVTWQAQSVFNS